MRFNFPEEMDGRCTAARLMLIRLNARHGMAQMDYSFVAELHKETGIPADEIRKAEQQGATDRARGMRCLCSQCEIDGVTIGDKERLRMAYVDRRLDELAKQGVATENAWAQVNQEIEDGRAMQEAPVRITRSKAQ